MAVAARMVRVARVADPFEAKLLAARLGAEGIVWELRGNVDGVYPIGPFELLVEEQSASDVRALLATDARSTDGTDGFDPDDLQVVGGVRRSWLFTALVVTAALGFLVLRTLILWGWG